VSGSIYNYYKGVMNMNLKYILVAVALNYNVFCNDIVNQDVVQDAIETKELVVKTTEDNKE
jgi:hypothetical protein